MKRYLKKKTHSRSSAMRGILIKLFTRSLNNLVKLLIKQVSIASCIYESIFICNYIAIYHLL